MDRKNKTHTSSVPTSNQKNRYATFYSQSKYSKIVCFSSNWKPMASAFWFVYKKHFATWRNLLSILLFLVCLCAFLFYREKNFSSFYSLQLKYLTYPKWEVLFISFIYQNYYPQLYFRCPNHFTYIYIYIYIYTVTYAHTYTHIYIYIWIYIYMCVCVCARARVCICICVYVCVSQHLHTNTMWHKVNFFVE